MNPIKLYRQHQNIINYVVIGVSAIVVDLSFFLLFFNVFHLPPLVATVMSVSIATIYAFTLNAVFNFKTKDFIKTRFFSYTLVSFLGMIGSASIIHVLVVMSLDPNIAKIVSLAPIVVLQYILNRAITFKVTA